MTLNKVMLIGNLGKDPEIRHTKNGDPVANFTVATSEHWKDRQGQKQERTEWHRCVAWRHLAELTQNYLHKGSKIYLEGKIETREWTDSENVKRFRTEIVVNTIQFLTPRTDAGASRTESPRTEAPRPATNEPPPAKPAPETSPQTVQEPYVDDDIPF